MSVEQYHAIHLGAELPQFSLPLTEQPQDYGLARETVDDLCARALDLAISLSGDSFFWVQAGSRYAPLLEKHAASERVGVCEDPRRLLFQKKAFVLVDDAEYAALGDVTRSIGICPATFVTSSKLLFLAVHAEYFVQLTRLLQGMTKMQRLSFIGLATCEEDNFLLDILYMLSDGLVSLRKVGLQRCGCNSAAVSECVWGKHPPRRASRTAGFALNARRPQVRDGLALRAADCYFAHGAPRKEPLEAVTRKPFIFWFYPGAGRSRLTAVIYPVLKELGLFSRVYDDTYYVAPVSAAPADTAPELPWHGSVARKVVDIYNMLPPNSFLYIHQPYYDIRHILENSPATLCVSLRDMRDVLIAHLFYYFGENIARDKRRLERLALRHMRAPLAGETQRSGFTALRDQALWLLGRDNVHWIRFEDVHAAPNAAYRDFFARLGLMHDPLWVEERMTPLLNASIAASLPKPGGSPDQRKGTTGDWANHFTPAMKDCFKEHMHGLLAAYGYEQDDNW